MFLKKALLSIFILVLFNACNVTDEENEENKPPKVSVGADQTVTVNQSVLISGIGTDSDGTISSYEWKKDNITLATTTSFEYTPTVVGTDTLTFTVTDNDGATVTNSVTITVTEEDIPTKENKPPKAFAGGEQTVTVNKTITLTGKGTDSDGTITSYEWKKDNTVLATTASFEYTPTIIGTDSLTLTVTDNDGATATDSVTINVIEEKKEIPLKENEPPKIDVEEEQTITVNQTIKLIGTGTDSDGTITSYEWKKDNTVLANTASFEYTPTVVGTDNLTLTVTDNDGATATESVIINVIDEENKAPTANAGDDQTITVNQTITVTGTATDSDGTITSYEWKKDNTILATTDSFEYTPTVVGTDTLTLTVTDNDGAVADDTVTITVSDIATLKTPKLLTTLPLNTIDKDISIEIEGVEGADVYLDGKKVGVIDSNNKSIFLLNLSEGENSFAINLQNNYGSKSDALNISILRVAKSTPEKLSFYIKEHSSVIGEYYKGGGYSAITSIASSNDGKKIYVALGEDIEILDVSNPTQPFKIGTYNSNSSYNNNLHLSKDGTKVYFSNSIGLQIVDISNPLFPTLIGEYKSGQLKSLTISKDGKKAYLLNYEQLEIVDLSDISDPVSLGTYDTPATENICLSSDETKAYLIRYSDLEIINISTPSSIKKVGEYDIGEISMQKIAVSADDKRAYVTGIKNQNGFLFILDISDSSSCKTVGSYSYNLSAPNKILLSKDETKVYMVDSTSGLHIVDISGSPKLISNYSTSYIDNLAISSDETKAYVNLRGGVGLKIIDIFNPIPSTVKGIYKSKSNGESRIINHITLSADETKAHITVDNYPLEIIDISTHPSFPSKISNYPVEGKKIIISKDGTKAYLTDNYYGSLMKIVDISNSTSLTLLGSYDTSNIDDIAISSNNRRAYVSTTKGLLILDISNSSSPVLLGKYEESKGGAIILSLDEKRVYLGNGYGEIAIVDVSNIASPILIGTSDINSRSATLDLALSLDGKKVYVIDYKLDVLDISDQTSPTTVNRYNPYSNHIYAIDLSKNGTKAYLAINNSELHILDVSSSPTLFGWYNISGYPQDISVSSDETRAYVATGSNGLQIIDLTISIHHKPKNFVDTLLKLEINNNISKDMKLTVSTNRSDIITIGNYPKTLTYKEYQKQDVKIPISSVLDAVGQTIITLTLSNDKETITRKVYFNVYP